MSKTRRCSCIVLHPVCFLIFLMVVVLSLAGSLIFLWISRVAKVENEVKLTVHNTNQELSSLIHKNIILAFVLLMIMIGVVVVIICVFVCLIVEAARREMCLRGALINQMEATQQSERKSMNKSLAFSSASHDIRASLACIRGLIEICRNEVSKRDRVLKNLQQMEDCTRDLFGILNSILDMSKIEAGKMQLEEQEFDIEQLLEDVVDLCHTIGMKKGVDVILDPYDGSVMKYHRVVGDRGKLKQILINLLSNAVKFTSEGHVTVRSWARKPSLENDILSSDRRNSMCCLSCMLFKIKRVSNDSDDGNAIRRDPNCMEFIFEVNDTGKGIPKEKQKFVFENYVQVKETALGEEGTGLGLGIVQSLVRLMGGEIGIADKEVGERGTCFRFNVLLSTSDADISMDARATDIEANVDYIPSYSFQLSGPLTRSHSPKTEPSQVVLLIQSAKRSKILQNYMQRLGLKVHVVKQHEQLSQALKRVKHKLNLSRYSSSGKSEGSSTGDLHGSSTRSKEVPLSPLHGADDILPSQKKLNPRGSFFFFILLVIDTSAGPYTDISRVVAEFRRDLNDNSCCRIVWLDTSDAITSSNEEKLPPSDLVISKPFHGSRLHQTLRLLPEFGGITPKRGDKAQPRNITNSSEASTSHVATKSGTKVKFSAIQKGEIEEDGDPNKPLMKKKILIVDDDPIGLKIATFMASQLGANIFFCENGEEAWKLVCRRLRDGSSSGASNDSLPFDCILMDCEMPVMDGREATARIREAEESYGVRIPIVALTAHDRGEEMNKMIQAGVDGYLTKPFNQEDFLKAVYMIL